MEYCQVRVRKGEREDHCTIRKGLSFQALSLRNELPIEYDCREADCGICVIRVTSGAANISPVRSKEADFLKAMLASPDERLACQCRILGDVEVEVEF